MDEQLRAVLNDDSVCLGKRCRIGCFAVVEPTFICPDKLAIVAEFTIRHLKQDSNNPDLWKLLAATAHRGAEVLNQNKELSSEIFDVLCESSGDIICLPVARALMVSSASATNIVRLLTTNGTLDQIVALCCKVLVDRLPKSDGGDQKDNMLLEIIRSISKTDFQRLLSLSVENRPGAEELLDRTVFCCQVSWEAISLLKSDPAKNDVKEPSNEETVVNGVAEGHGSATEENANNDVDDNQQSQDDQNAIKEQQIEWMNGLVFDSSYIKTLCDFLDEWSSRGNNEVTPTKTLDFICWEVLNVGSSLGSSEKLRVIQHVLNACIDTKWNPGFEPELHLHLPLAKIADWTLSMAQSLLVIKPETKNLPLPVEEVDVLGGAMEKILVVQGNLYKRSIATLVNFALIHTQCGMLRELITMFRSAFQLDRFFKSFLNTALINRQWIVHQSIIQAICDGLNAVDTNLGMKVLTCILLVKPADNSKSVCCYCELVLRVASLILLPHVISGKYTPSSDVSTCYEKLLVRLEQLTAQESAKDSLGDLKIALGIIQEFFRFHSIPLGKVDQTTDVHSSYLKCKLYDKVADIASAEISQDEFNSTVDQLRKNDLLSIILHVQWSYSPVIQNLLVGYLKSQPDLPANTVVMIAANINYLVLDLTKLKFVIKKLLSRSNCVAVCRSLSQLGGFKNTDLVTSLLTKASEFCSLDELCSLCELLVTDDEHEVNSAPPIAANIENDSISAAIICAITLKRTLVTNQNMIFCKTLLKRHKKPLSEMEPGMIHLRAALITLTKELGKHRNFINELMRCESHESVVIARMFEEFFRSPSDELPDSEAICSVLRRSNPYNTRALTEPLKDCLHTVLPLFLEKIDDERSREVATKLISSKNASEELKAVFSHFLHCAVTKPCNPNVIHVVNSAFGSYGKVADRNDIPYFLRLFNSQKLEMHFIQEQLDLAVNLVSSFSREMAHRGVAFTIIATQIFRRVLKVGSPTKIVITYSKQKSWAKKRGDKRPFNAKRGPQATEGEEKIKSIKTVPNPIYDETVTEDVERCLHKISYLLGSCANFHKNVGWFHTSLMIAYVKHCCEYAVSDIHANTLKILTNMMRIHVVGFRLRFVRMKLTERQKALLAELLVTNDTSKDNKVS